MNRDGALDVVCCNIDAGIQVSFNDGTAAPFSSGLGVGVGTGDPQDSIFSVNCGDVDGDGDIDLVFGCHDRDIWVRLNDGSPLAFNGYVSYRAITDARSWALDLADMNKDGMPDIVASHASGCPQVYLNTSSGKSISFSAGIDVGPDNVSAYDLLCDDFNGDGYPDIAISASEESAVYLNAGAGHAPFSSNTVAHVLYAVGGDSVFMDSADLDGNGYPDLAIAQFEGENQIYLNAGRRVPLSTCRARRISDDALITAAVACGDMDGDGDLDLVTGNGGWTSEPDMLYLNNGSSDPFNGVAGLCIGLRTNETDDVAVADFDRDGDLDLVTAGSSRSTRIHLNDGTAEPFQDNGGTRLQSSYTGTCAIAVADFNGDSYADLACCADDGSKPLYLYLNAGSAAPFHGVPEYLVVSDTVTTTDLTAGDFNGDGHWDLAVARYNQAALVITNNRTTSPFSGVTPQEVPYSGGEENLAIAAGDVDGDGDTDLVIGAEDTNPSSWSYVYFNEGPELLFSSGTRAVVGDRQYTAAVGLVDWDRDGDLDLVKGNLGGAQLFVNNGSALPFTGVSAIDLPAEGRDVAAFAFGDVDGDGVPDILMGNSDFGGPAVNAFCTSRGYDTTSARLTAGTASGKAGGVNSVYLAPEQDVPPNTSIQYQVSNNGGRKWYSAEPWQEFTFPSAGSNLCWRVEFSSRSPAVSPVIDALWLSYLEPPRICGARYVDGNAVVEWDAKSARAYTLSWAPSLDGSPWSDVPGAVGLPGSDGVMVVTNALPSGSMFFRVRIEE
jgi:hypothetical protein